MQANTDKDKKETNISNFKPSYVWLGLLTIFLAYLVTKDVQLPKIFLIAGTLFGCLLLFFQGLKKPEIVTYVLIAYLPFSRILAGDFSGVAMAFNFTNLLTIFLIIVWLMGTYAEGEPLWTRTFLNIPIIIFMIAGFIAVLRGNYYESGYLRYGIIEYKRWMTPVFLYFLALNTIKDRDKIKTTVIIMSITVAVVGLMAIYDYIDLGPVSSLEKARIGGIAEQPNMLAAFFNYYMFLPLGFLLMNLNKARYWTLLIPFLIAFRGIMVTFSRGGYLAFAAGLYAITFFKSKILFLGLVLLTLVVWLNPVFLPAGIRYRMGQTLKNHSYVESGTFSEADLESSAKGRVDMWRASLEMIKDYPFFGVGYGLFPYMIKRYIDTGGRVTDAHNTYLIIAGEMGIPTLLIFLWIVGLVFVYTRDLYLTTRDPFAKAVALGFLGGLFGLLVSNMFGSRLDSQEISSYFWILSALIMRLRIIERKKFPYEVEPKGIEKKNFSKLDACMR